MVIFLDCDWTIFDAQGFIDYLDSHEGLITELIHDNPVAPFSRWLYGDVRNFCSDAQKRGYKLVILSMAQNIEGQREKILNSGIGDFVDDIIVVSGEKSSALTAWLSAHGEPPQGHYFIDDNSLFLDDVKRTNPKVYCIRIDRESPRSGGATAAAPDLSDRTIASLDELRPLLGMPIKT